MDAHTHSCRNCFNCFKSRYRQPGTMETWIRRIFALLVFMFIAQLIINVLTFNGGAHVSWTLPLWNMSTPERNESQGSHSTDKGRAYEYLVDVLRKQITPTLPPCPAMPPGLGTVNKSEKFRNPVQTVLLSNKALEKKLWWVEHGGAWSPSECTPQHKVAIIIPYHDREEHLNIFLHHIHPFLKRQQLNYRIFIIEQSEPVQFNRGALMNIGFTEALRMTPHWDCFIFHDVDLLPENDENLYSCPVMPRHMSVAVNTLFYRLPYHNIFGGVEAFSTAHFQLINGFSNAYFGWGGEDDDLYNRVVFKHLNLTRYSESIARYTMIPHTKQQPSTHNGILLKQGPERFEVDGLNSLTYIAQVKEERKLYTYIRVSLVPLRESVKKMLQTFPDLMDKS